MKAYSELSKDTKDNLGCLGIIIIVVLVIGGLTTFGYSRPVDTQYLQKIAETYAEAKRNLNGGGPAHKEYNINLIKRIDLITEDNVVSEYEYASYDNYKRKIWDKLINQLALDSIKSLQDKPIGQEF